MPSQALRQRARGRKFRPRARVLLLLGDQLIRDPGIAVFELVKNAYDADSPLAIVTMSRLSDPDEGKIIVEDSGTGMDFETVTRVWLEPGTDYRQLQRDAGVRTPRFHRLPIGEKGVGRFAAHKLGRLVKLITRKKDNPEVVVEIDWDVLLEHKYLDDVEVVVKQQEPRLFTGSRTGTRIEINKLRQEWNRRMVRDFARAITSICSPFSGKGEFTAKLVLTENVDWLDGLLSVDQVLEYALFKAHCDIDGRELTYRYEFTPFPGMHKVRSRRSQRVLPLADRCDLSKHRIGPVHLDIHIFDRDPRVLELGVTDKKGLREFLDEAGGIRVYRDGIRVYDYGEPGNDWLRLGGRRINVPTQRISNNLVIGAASLELTKSKGLVEKTNREGFVENEAYRAFRDAVGMAIVQIEAERNKDKKRIRETYSGPGKEPVLDTLAELRSLVYKKKLTEVEPYLDRIEADFVDIRDRFLVSAGAGLSLSTVIHEIEKGVDELRRAVENEQASPRVRELARHLAELTEGFSALTRKSGITKERANSLISQALFNTELRLKAHDIAVVRGVQDDRLEVECSRRLIIATLMNLIDNSIYWLDNKWDGAKNKKQIYLGPSNEFSIGPGIIVADNGPGFLDPPEYLVQPFFTRKPDGMGLGLHVADQVMRAQGGRLEFPEHGDISLPDGFAGAVVALVFRGAAR